MKNNGIESDYLWLCPLCQVYFNKNNGEKQKHIQEEIKLLKDVINKLENEK